VDALVNNACIYEFLPLEEVLEKHFGQIGQPENIDALTHAARASKIRRGVRSGLPRQRIFTRLSVPIQRHDSDRERVMVAFDSPCNLNDAVMIGPDQEADGVGFGCGSPRTCLTSVAMIAAVAQGFEGNQSRGLGRALAPENIAERHGTARKISERRRGDEKRAGHDWTL
jgi:hypothetical protein